MKKDLLETLDKIYNAIKDNNPSLSLLGGGPGINLFKLYYLKHRKKNELDENLVDNIQKLSEIAINYDNTSTFCGGQAGINWFFSHLYQQKYIDKTDYKTIVFSDSMLTQAAIHYLSVQCYDFLHGAVGIAHYLLYTNNKNLLPFFNQVLDELVLLSKNENGMIYHFDFETHKLDKTKINPSLAHGLASVLKFCIECYQKNINRKKSKYLADSIVDFLLNNLNKDTSHSFFPNVYVLTNNDIVESRLAWCYGDMGIAYVLYQYGRLFKDALTSEIALKILHHAANRKTELESGVTDAGLCHGSSGVAYIFSKLYHITGDIIFYDAANFWFQKTLAYSVHEKGLAGYQKFDAIEKVWVNDSGLLEGVAGIGLTIIGHLFKDYSWDYCLMLND